MQPSPVGKDYWRHQFCRFRIDHLPSLIRHGPEPASFHNSRIFLVQLSLFVLKLPDNAFPKMLRVLSHTPDLPMRKLRLAYTATRDRDIFFRFLLFFRATVPGCTCYQLREAFPDKAWLA